MTTMFSTVINLIKLLEFKVDLVAFSLEVDKIWAPKAEAYVFLYGSREIYEGC